MSTFSFSLRRYAAKRKQTNISCSAYLINSGPGISQYNSASWSRWRKIVHWLLAWNGSHLVHASCHGGFTLLSHYYWSKQQYHRAIDRSLSAFLMQLLHSSQSGYLDFLTCSDGEIEYPNNNEGYLRWYRAERSADTESAPTVSGLYATCLGFRFQSTLARMCLFCWWGLPTFAISLAKAMVAVVALLLV